MGAEGRSVSLLCADGWLEPGLDHTTTFLERTSAGCTHPWACAIAREVIHTKHCAHRVQEMEAKLGERFGLQEDRRVGSRGFLKSRLPQCHPSSTPGGTHPGWRPIPGGMAGGQGEGSVQTCPPEPRGLLGDWGLEKVAGCHLRRGALRCSSLGVWGLQPRPAEGLLQAQASACCRVPLSWLSLARTAGYLWGPLPPGSATAHPSWHGVADGMR